MMKHLSILILCALLIVIVFCQDDCNWKVSIGPVNMCIGHITLDTISDIQTATVVFEKKKTTLKDIFITMKCMELMDETINPVVYLSGDTLVFQYTESQNNSDEQFTLGDKSPTYSSDGSYDENEDFL